MRTVEVIVPVEAVHRDTTYLPELRIDTVTVQDTVAMYVDAKAYRQLRNGLTLQEGKIKATVQLTDEGLQLSVEQEADTITASADVHVPQYEIEVKKKAELSGWQKFCYELGLGTFVIIIIGLVIGLGIIVVKFFL